MGLLPNPSNCQEAVHACIALGDSQVGPPAAGPLFRSRLFAQRNEGIQGSLGLVYSIRQQPAAVWQQDRCIQRSQGFENQLHLLPSITASEGEALMQMLGATRILLQAPTPPALVLGSLGTLVVLSGMACLSTCPLGSSSLTTAEQAF